jgi:hypothetical protein
MKTCENCGSEIHVKYGSGRFCSSFCARGFSTKSKREEINEKLKIPSKYKKERICKYCGGTFFKRKRANKETGESSLIKYCSSLCGKLGNTKSLGQYRREKCKDPKEKERLKEIGRIGGYGMKGYTDRGTYYQSILEKNCFEFLEESNIKFEAHKSLPHDTRETDIYLNDIDVWIELDGIDREKKKNYIGKNYDRWIEKLNFYKQNKLEYHVFYSEVELISYVCKVYNLKKGGSND